MTFLGDFLQQNRHMIKPARLHLGDTIGIISPSASSAALYPDRFERGIRYIEFMGLQVKVGRHALNTREYVSDIPEHRAEDIHEMFCDPDVKAIIATIGGDHSCHLLPLLDFELIKRHPKILMGFSDVTVLDVAIWTMTGLVTFYGPTLMTELAEYPRMPTYSEHYMFRALSCPLPIGPISASTWWTDEFLDWAKKENLTRPRMLQATDGWTWLRGGFTEGFLVGGCLQSLQHLRGTRYWPDCNGAILFLETSETAISLSQVDAIIMDYANMGVFSQIVGLLVGRPRRYTSSERQRLREVILEHTRHFDFPIITDMDFGHTSPMLTLPLGCKAIIDVEHRVFSIIESAVE